MTQELYTNLGIAGALLGVIYMMLRWFMGTLDRKDQYIEDLIKEFQSHVEICNSNFVKFGDRFSKISGKQTIALNNLIEKIENLDVK